MEWRRHLVAKNRNHDVLLIKHAHTDKRYFFLLFVFRLSRDRMPTRVSKVQNQNQRVCHITIRGQIISASHHNLCGLPNGTFVHSLQNIAFRSYRN